jgi:hypothetical protein
VVASSLVFAQNDKEGWSSDVVVPGTKWVYNVQTGQGRAVQCQVELNVSNDNPDDPKRIITFAILSKSSRVIALRDELMRNQLGGGWIVGENYNVVLFLEDTPSINLESKIVDDEILVVILPKHQPTVLDAIYRAKRLYFAVGGLATGGFDVPGLLQAIEQPQ